MDDGTSQDFSATEEHAARTDPSESRDHRFALMIVEPTGRPRVDLGMAVVARFAIYSGVLLLLMLSLPRLIAGYGVRAYMEGGPLELIQLACIALVAVLCTTLACLRPTMRGPLWLLATVAGVAITRELDEFLDARIAWGGWVLVAGLVGIVGGVLAWSARRTFIGPGAVLLRSAAFPLMWVGAVLVLIVGQLAGHGPTIEAVLGDGTPREGKRYIEETIETVGYMLLLFGTIELAIGTPQVATGAPGDRPGHDVPGAALAVDVQAQVSPRRTAPHSGHTSSTAPRRS